MTSRNVLKPTIPILMNILMLTAAAGFLWNSYWLETHDSIFRKATLGEKQDQNVFSDLNKRVFWRSSIIMTTRFYWLKLIAGVLLIAMLFFFNVKISAVSVNMRASILQWMILAGMMHISGLFISACRWRMLLSACSVNIPLSNLMRSYLIGGFINWFLPSKIGGDIYRVMDSKKQCGSVARSFSVIFIEGITSVFGLILIGMAAAFIYSRSANQGSEAIIFPLLILPLLGILVLAVALYFWIHFPDRVKTMTEKLSRKRFSKISSTLLTAPEVLKQFWESKRTLGYAFLLSSLLQVNLILYYYFIMRGLG